ncbi:hypothetical protein ACFQE0_17580 [Methylobacterium komagatae]|uniref:Uncharacterized protein n=1 Tax=Methylobacterium komagatae TaxID=374425 RepID=A0ABW2BME4_9HYPH
MNIQTSAEPLLPQNFDSQIGLVFKRLAGIYEACGQSGLETAVRATLVALGRVALEEGERRARALSGRTAPRPGDVRVTAQARRTGDPDTFDVAD